MFQSCKAPCINEHSLLRGLARHRPKLMSLENKNLDGVYGLLTISSVRFMNSIMVLDFYLIFANLFLLFVIQESHAWSANLSAILSCRLAFIFSLI